MKIFKFFLKRLLIVTIPLLGLYYYSELAFEANRQKEHPTDVGLGIAVYLFIILFIIFLVFTIDTINRLLKKEYKTLMINMVFLLPIIILIIYTGTLFYGGPLYESVRNLNNQNILYLGLIYLVLISFGFLIIYKCNLKIILVYLTILFISGGGYFYHRYSIEAYYGKNKGIFFQGESNDTIIVLASDNMSVITEGKIERKTWNRIYIKTDKNTAELNDWIKPIAKEYSDSIKCKIYKPYH